MAGDLSSAAVSRTALTVLVLMTLMAGKAKFLALASAKRACKSSPEITPGLICGAFMVSVPITVDQRSYRTAEACFGSIFASGKGLKLAKCPCITVANGG